MAAKEVAELTKLDGSNYTMWEFELKHLIAAKGLTGYIIDGTVQAPTAEANSGKDLASHLQKASQASVLLIASVDLKIRPLLIN